MLTIPTTLNRQSPKSDVQTITIHGQHPKSIRKTIPINRKSPKSFVWIIPIIRKHQPLIGSTTIITRQSPKPIVRTNPINTVSEINYLDNSNY